MSYDVYLCSAETGEPLTVNHHAEGGTYAVSGSTEAHLNITFNYAEIYAPLGFNVKKLDGTLASDSIAILEPLVNELGTRQYHDYWAPTRGNAGYALNILLEWARIHPDGVWRVEY